MSTHLDRDRVRKYLDDIDLHALFINELRWDKCSGSMDAEVTVSGKTFSLETVAQKRGLVVYQYVADSSNAFPDHPTRRKIEKKIAKIVHEHLIIYIPNDRSALYWQWVKREPGHPDRVRQHIYYRGQQGEALIQRLQQIVFTLDDEEILTVVEVSGRVRAAFNIERVTKRFYDRFKTEHRSFIDFIEGIENVADREWYASLMLNRMMFIYFIQKRGFLDGDINYLRNRLDRMQKNKGKKRFITFYRFFLLQLFHKGLGQPETNRDPSLIKLLGQVPYLNGGLFEVHTLEHSHPKIDIPDTAFEKIFSFFDAYQWHLDDRPLRNDNEINPDILGYIFEKYVNQKQMGAYYTKEDITGYISRNTIIPFLFNQTEKSCSIAFTSNGGVWSLLKDDPDRYFHEEVRHGITYDIYEGKNLSEKRELPPLIAIGLNDISKRSNWNKPASSEYGLPTETWREHVARRQHYEQIRARLAAGEITCINDFITHNLDIEKFVQDVISGSEGPELIRAFWKSLSTVSILDPTCGSGAFLFAALNVLEPIYMACLEAMRGFVDDLERSNRKNRLGKMKDFQKVLDQVSGHANERYFILKSIIIKNLYGVDIMEEAAEICKLRLFLKLVAQLESYDQIEPLPDVDFNVRAGNTLVGFTSMGELARAVEKKLIKPQSLPSIEKRAEMADEAFHTFCEMQAKRNLDAGAFAKVKLELQERLHDLRVELNHYMAEEYGINTGEQRKYQKWHDDHQPFHWFVEFYGIMHKGGFDVIIGNPPYVEYKEVREKYQVMNYKTLKCGNLYAFIMERCKQISNSESMLSMIVPLSGHSTKRMLPLVHIFYEQFKLCYLFNISADAHPSILFPGVKFRLAIFIASNQGEGIYTSGYSRWYAAERDHLFNMLHYTNIGSLRYATTIPKVSNQVHLQILEKMYGHKETLQNSITTERLSKLVLLYHAAPVNWIRAHTEIPHFWNERDGEKISLKPLSLHGSVEGLHGVLCSTLFFIWWLSHSDCYHLNLSEISTFPKYCDDNNDQLVTLSKKLEKDMRAKSKRRTYYYRSTGKVEYDEFYMKESKHIIDKIDTNLAKLFNLTDEELDFIINYDIKYRMGQGSTAKT